MTQLSTSLPVFLCRTTTAHLFVVMAALTSLIPGDSAQANWSRYLGDHRNATADTDILLADVWPESGPKEHWSVDIGEGFGGVAIRDSQVFLLDRVPREKDVLRVFDLKTGKELWSVSIPSPGALPFPGSRSVPTVDDERVYCATGMGIFFCVDRKSRQILYQLDTVKFFDAEVPRFGYSYHPELYKNLVILAPMGPKAGLAALNQATGKEVWRSPGLFQSNSTPQLYRLAGREQLIFMTSSTCGTLEKQGDRWTTALDPATGKQLWRLESYPQGNPISAPLQVADDHLFITGGYDAGSRLIYIHSHEDKLNPIERFSLDKGSQIHGGVLYENHIYTTANENKNQSAQARRRNGGLMCIDLSGNIKWRTGNNPNFGLGSIIRINDRILIQDGFNGHLILVKPDPRKYVELARYNVFGKKERDEDKLWAPMAFSDGRLLLRSHKQLKCLELPTR